MTLIAFCSGKGSPGVSTLACVVGAVWPSTRPVVMAECDPSGNDLAVRFGLSPRIGMTSLVLARRHRDDTKPSFDAHLQSLPGGLGVLVGPVNPDASGSLDRELSAVGAGIFPESVDVLLDCGRVLGAHGGQRELLQSADRVVVVSRPDIADLAHARWTLDLVRELPGGVEVSLVLVGSGRFGSAEIEHALTARPLGVMPLDVASAAVVCGSPGRAKRFARSPLVAAARQLVDRLSRHAAPNAVEPEVGQAAECQDSIAHIAFNQEMESSACSKGETS